jgi:flagellar basal-body rod protein FlgF
MDNVMYVGLSRQMTLQRELDVVSNNIANAETDGFKVESLNVQTEPRYLPSNDDAQKTINFALDTGVVRDFTQGALKQTGAPLDMAISGQGFFSVSTPAGPRYTRDGHFTFDPQGRIVDGQGSPLLDSSGGEITVDLTLGEPTIGKDGTITQKGQVLGRVGVVRFAALAALSKDGRGNYRNDSNTQPQPAADAQVIQGSIEASNVQPVVQISKLIEVSRAYESIAQMMDQTAQLSSQTIDRLARVS